MLRSCSKVHGWGQKKNKVSDSTTAALSRSPVKNRTFLAKVFFVRSYAAYQ